MLIIRTAYRNNAYFCRVKCEVGKTIRLKLTITNKENDQDMKKFYTFIITLLIAQYSFAQWPANYGGVMLQAFYWDSYEDTRWTNLTSQADELSKYFDVMWVPNSGNCVSNGMGYMPVYWLDHRSSFGSRERYLTDMIQAYKTRGTKIIMDVVINHKAPLGKDGSYIDFANEERTGSDGTVYKLEWSGADICNNDDGGYIASLGWPVTGANDTGDDFSGARDLDHTSANVQQNCITYMKFLLKELGYSGYRLDMVKGYGAEYTKMYNEATQPEFCVGEYWDGYDAITNWINGTGKTSAAFDFPLKYTLKDAFAGNWSALNTKGLAGDPNYARYSVTFVDNHDTYENSSRHTTNVLGANGFILAMPGTPCIFLKHWQRYPIAIGNMILARKACGVTNQSQITEQQEVSGGYVIKTQGTKGTVLFICGFPQYDTTGFKLIASGTNFAYFVSDNITVEGLTPGSDEDDTEQRNVTVYIDSEVQPNLYAWTGAGELLGAWPGIQLSEKASVTSIDGTVTKNFWKHTFTTAPVNIVINNGAGVQTADITGLGHDSYFTFDDTNSEKETNWTDITSQFYTPEPVELPSCVKPLPGHLYCYFKGNKDFDKPYAWVWNDSKNFCVNTVWPGDKMTNVGSDGIYAVWRWDFGTIADGAEMPTGVLFSNNGDDEFKTDDFVFENGGYYDVYGYIANANTPTAISAVRSSSPAETVAPRYDLQGRRVGADHRGIVIQNGRKMIVR